MLQNSTRRSARNVVGGILAFASLTVGAACMPQPTGPGTSTTSTTTTTTTVDPNAPAVSGSPCPTSSGVTVVVDYTELNNSIQIGCAEGPQASGLAALAAAGFSTSDASADGTSAPGTLCTIDSLPTQGFPYCWTTGGYWGYWRASNPGTWAFSTTGPGTGPLVEGRVEGWAWAQDFNGSEPRIAVDQLSNYLAN